MVRAFRRLPGVRFEAVAPALDEALPRMDVAAFVGLAASGPLDVPVAVEDIAHFQSIFGDDAPLAWDAEQGRTAYAALAPAVRAFFRNGGVRCWIVRTARREGDPGGAPARASAFGLSAVWHYDPDTRAFSAAAALARSEGSWADALAVTTALASERVQAPLGTLDAARATDPAGALALVVSARDGRVGPGDLLRVSFGAGPVLFMPVTSVVPLGPPVPAPNVVPLGKNQALRVLAATPVWLDPAAKGAPALANAPVDPASLPVASVEVLNFDLYWRRGHGQPERLTALGFCPKSARYWAALPRDVDLFAADPLGADTDDLRRPASDGTSPYAELQNQAADPRVPLAGSGETSGFFLPWGLGPTPGDWQSADTGPGDALARDGLENFDASLFLDPELRGASLTNLGTTADYLAYQSPKPRRLRGIHALLGVEEATLVAVPDAAQRAWERVTVGEPAPPRPNPTSVSAMPCCDATTADRTFSPCDREPPKAPELDAPAVSDPSGSYSLDWTPVMDAVFELAEALEPDFEGALLFALDERTRIDFQGRGPGDYYYRVRARVRGIAGNWSTPRVVRVPLPAASRLDAPDAYRADTLLAVQRALLRLCAARGDLFAAISVPEHYLEEQVLEHAELLRSPLAADTAGVAPLGFAESNALSFGGLYYPWLIGREETASGELRSTPPEGAALGICARRSIERGAWVAPANEPLTGVVALRSRPQGERLERLYAAQINVVRRDPRGFLALGADTLSFAEELTAINVRRLLCLLRRAALQRGQEYVFEPNDAAFRRQVERGFEALLGDLYQRGAFAGASPQQAFQVVTGSDSNSASSVEQGRFFVDLKVAPSLPLSFLTVRLVQTSDRSSVTEVH